MLYPDNLDVAHSWTYTGEVARPAVDVAHTDAVWGRPWFVPATSEDSVRALTGRLARLVGSPVPVLTSMSDEVLEELPTSEPALAEVAEMRYLDDDLLTLDSPAAPAGSPRPAAVPRRVFASSSLAGAVRPAHPRSGRPSRRRAVDPMGPWAGPVHGRSP